MMSSKFIMGLSFLWVLNLAPLTATQVVEKNVDDVDVFQKRALSYFDQLNEDDKVFFKDNFSLDDLCGEQNDTALTTLCLMAPNQESRERYLEEWSALRKTKNSPEDIVGILSHHLRRLVLGQDQINSSWLFCGFEIMRRARHVHGFSQDDYQVSLSLKAIELLSAWSPEKDLPWNVFNDCPHRAHMYLGLENLKLLRAKSHGKSVSWYLKSYQECADRIQENIEFYSVPHTAQTPRTLITRKNPNSLREYFPFYIDLGRVFQNIFQARIHFLTMHAVEIDGLLNQGYVFNEDGLTLPKRTLHQNWHDLRPVDYYFSEETPNSNAPSALLRASPNIRASKQVLTQRQLPHTSAFADLKTEVEAYHSVKKKDLMRVEDRKIQLHEISRKAAALIEREQNVSTLSSQQLGMLMELQAQALHKSEYLGRLQNTLQVEERRRNLIPYDKSKTSAVEIRKSQRAGEIYDDIDPESRSLPYQYEYEKLTGKTSDVDSDVKLRKVAHLLDVDEEEFNKEENEGYYQTALSKRVDVCFERWINTTRTHKNVAPFFLWLETKNLEGVDVDLRRAVPQSEMFLDVQAGKAFNPVFLQQNQAIIEDGVYLYVIPEDGKMYVFPGERSALAKKEDNATLHAIAQQKYGVDFSEFSTRSVHPLLCKGENVLCAGEVKFKDGQIVHINNESGHYLPHRYHLLNGIQRLLPMYRFLFSNATEVKVNGYGNPMTYENFIKLDIKRLKEDFLYQEAQ